MQDAEELVLLGKITKPHGIRGEVKVYPFSGVPENLLHYSTLLFGAIEDDDPLQELAVLRARVQKNCVLMQLKGCSTRNDAETMVGSQVYIVEKNLPELSDDEFYLRDLEGKQIVTVQGKQIGKVTGIILSGSQEIIQVKDGQHEFLIPLVPDFIVSLDSKELTVDLPPGLLEINQ